MNNKVFKHGIIFNGDCLSIMDALIDKNIKVDTIITDPPYDLDFHGGGKQSRAKDYEKVKENIDFMSYSFDEKILDKMLQICKIPNILIFCSNKQISWLMSYFESKGLSTTLLVWKKTNACPLGKGKYISDLEFIVFARGKNVPFNNEIGYKYKYKCKQYPFVSGKGRLHPAQKPIELIEELVKLHSFEGQVILDCFMGSGTTCIACQDTNRNFIGIELNNSYFEVANKRIKENE